MGIIYILNKKEKKEALKCFKEAIKIDQLDSKPYNNIGNCLLDTNYTKLAI